MQRAHYLNAFKTTLSHDLMKRWLKMHRKDVTVIFRPQAEMRQLPLEVRFAVLESEGPAATYSVEIDADVFPTEYERRQCWHFIRASLVECAMNFGAIIEGAG
jgi:hypothetical protein